VENTSSILDKEFWDGLYTAGVTGWDLGAVSPPLQAYIDQLPDKNIRILIPGCGNAWEAAYLAENGFRNVTLIDIAPTPVKKTRELLGEKVTVVEGDFFDLEGQYDLILEQTFFCALDPALRERYVLKMTALLAPGGMLAGVLFNTKFEKQGPPFGGTAEEYRHLFSGHLEMITMEPCYNSVKPRMGNELFIQFKTLKYSAL